jgi:hypothetical protein
MNSRRAWPRESGHILRRETANSTANADARGSTVPCKGRRARAGGCGR